MCEKHARQPFQVLIALAAFWGFAAVKPTHQRLGRKAIAAGAWHKRHCQYAQSVMGVTFASSEHKGISSGI